MSQALRDRYLAAGCGVVHALLPHNGSSYSIYGRQALEDFLLLGSRVAAAFALDGQPLHHGSTYIRRQQEVRFVRFSVAIEALDS